LSRRLSERWIRCQKRAQRPESGGAPLRASDGAAVPALVAFVLLLASSSVLAQEPVELTTQENPTTFKMEVQRNLVIVRAVVRDQKGNAVGSLRQEDFRLFDNGKPQTITHFSVETSAPKPATESKAQQAHDDGKEGEGEAAAQVAPLRYVGLYFDDVHAGFEDLVRSRDAAEGYLKSSVQKGDRIGIFTASGQGQADFTDDLDAIHKALFLLRPRPVVVHESDPCPDVPTYQAYAIVDRNDNPALQEVILSLLNCKYHGDTRFLQMATSEAPGIAYRNLNFAETETEASLRGLEQLVRRIAVLPGQRNLILVSPGFFTENQKIQISQLIDRALREKVVINALDSRGLYAQMPLGDATKHAYVVANRPDLVTHKVYIQLDSYQRDADVLAEIAAGTGGFFFQNSNDYDEGFRKVGALPEVYYVLTFSPANLKIDGRYHSLKVSLAHPEHLTLQARRGYFAPARAKDPAEREKQDIQEAVYSPDELSEIPVEVHTQFFKMNEQQAKLSVLTHVDLHLMQFRKEEGRNLNKLKLVTVLFDRDGKYITGQEKIVDFHLRDVSLQKLASSGITTKTSFDVQPGAYLVRQVVRDAEGGQISELNRAVEIPY
jgi:VWFA-related protein